MPVDRPDNRGWLRELRSEPGKRFRDLWLTEQHEAASLASSVFPSAIFSLRRWVRNLDGRAGRGAWSIRRHLPVLVARIFLRARQSLDAPPVPSLAEQPRGEVGVQLRCDPVAAVRIRGARIAVRAVRGAEPVRSVFEEFVPIWVLRLHSLRFAREATRRPTRGFPPAERLVPRSAR